MTTRAAPDASWRFDAARKAYEAGRPLEAFGLLTDLLRASPRFADAHFLAGLCLIDLGDFAAAEQSLKTAAGLDKRSPGASAVLGDLLRRPTRFAEAEKAYRAALAADRRHPGAVVGLARLLILLGRHEEALQLTAPLAAAPDAPVAVIEAHAEAQKHLGRMEEALALNRRAAEAGSASARLETAAVLRELGRYDEAEAAAREAFAHVGPAPAAFVVHARALQELDRVPEAEAACREALRRAPLDDRAHEHLAEIRLRRSGTPEEAFAVLDAAMRQHPAPGLSVVKARLLGRIGRRAEAYVLLAEAAARAPGDASLEAAAAKAALQHSPDAPELVDAALAHAERAYALAHDVPKIAALLGEMCLAAGQPERASRLAGALLRRSDNPALVALQAVAWRLLGDPRYHELYDYQRVVGSWVIERPSGWPTLEAYLADLAVALKAFHAVPLDSFGVARSGGVQTKQSIAASDGEVFRAFYEALDAPIRAYLARIGRGKDPLRRRNQGTYRPLSAWSVMTEPNGFHGNHLHSEGWLSSAFYVELPPAVDGEGRQGWIKFGEPGAPTRPKLGPEHHVKPDPGRFVLFPSYMWHGTEPFTGDGVRLIMSVDLVPASA